MVTYPLNFVYLSLCAPCFNSPQAADVDLQMITSRIAGELRYPYVRVHGNGSSVVVLGRPTHMLSGPIYSSTELVINIE